MIRDFHFKDIRKYLEKKNDTAVLDAFDKLADAAIIFSPLMFGPQFLPLLELLDVKDKLINIGKSVVDFIATRQEPNYIERAEQMKVAYALICYTAYFDSLNDIMPKDINKKLKLKFEKKFEIANGASQESVDSSTNLSLGVHCEIPYTDHVTSYSDTLEQLKKIYKKISEALINFITESKVLEKEFHSKDYLKELLLKLPQQAITRYQAQYLYLADTFSDFSFFAQSIEFEALHKSNKLHSEALNHIKLITNRIDIGLVNLYKIVSSISSDFSIIQSKEIVDDLKKAYSAIIEQPIIDDKEISSNKEVIRLTFPKIIEAFIPQSYKCLLYQTKDIRLEDEVTWDKLTVHDDLDRFFVKYLYSPDSIDFPLVILGHPGSGKSLLTKVLSAQLMSESYTVVRIPLREVNADAGIDILVEEHIKKVTNRPLPQGYGGFAKQFREKPLLIILDGYDELLQAKGDVFAGYLEKVRVFQQDQKLLDRPVRIIVTSRITLIDKAIVPINSTILRLKEFNEEQRNAWVNIWNETNASYFNSCTPAIKPFALPLSSNNQGKKSSLIELAEQPLLLLMLALYDSEGNSLATLQNDLKRTELYNNLLRRFVRRERGRYVSGFDCMSDAEQDVFIDKEMKRLGVVAIGMYNRRKLYIQTKELDSDLKFFELERNVSNYQSQKLKDSESLLGGFFFIHQSTAQDISANSNNADSAFEFLHNTFGEFLTADLILRFAVQEANIIHTCRNNSFLAPELSKKLNTPDGFCKEWFASLMFTPLYSRPVVIEMIQEHALHVINGSHLSESDFKENLKLMVKSQLIMIINAKRFPDVMTSEIEISHSIPLLGYISIYTLNLIILASVLCPEGFGFDEIDYGGTNISNSETRPWDKLAFLWRTWFSTENLTGLSAILKAYRKGSKVLIRCNDKFEAESYNQPIDILLCVSSTLADNLNAGLAGLQSQRFAEIVKMNENKIAEFLKSENAGLYLSYLTMILRRETNCGKVGEIDYRKINDLIYTIIHCKEIQNVNRDTMLFFLETIELSLNRNLIYFELKRELLEYITSTLNPRQDKESDAFLACAVRIMQILTSSSSRLVLDWHILFDEPFFRYEFNDFAYEVKHASRYFNHYLKSGRLYNFVGNLDAELSFLNAIENSTIDPKEKKYILKNIISERSIPEFVKTNPEFISRVLLILISSNKISDKKIDYYLKCFSEQIRITGINYIGDNAIINTIKIAQTTCKSEFMNMILEYLHRQIFKRHPEYFSFLMYSNPSFISDLIDLVPDLFTDPDTLKYVDRKPFGKRIHLNTQAKFFDYIKLFRKLNDINFDLFQWQLREMVQYLKSTILNDSYMPCDFRKMTIDQLQDLYWYANIIGDAELVSNIESVIKLPIAPDKASAGL